MASKANFTQGQWLKVLQSPLLAGFAVSAADPSGLMGILQEGMASAKGSPPPRPTPDRTS